MKQIENPPNYFTPFVALTAHTTKQKRCEAKESGFINIFQKPLTKEMVEQIVEISLLVD